MHSNLLQVDPHDNVLIAPANIRQGDTLHFAGESLVLATDVPAKHEFATQAPAPGVLFSGQPVEKCRTKAEILSQDDFVPWKRGVSL
jgi:hypothetical protein